MFSNLIYDSNCMADAERKKKWADMNLVQLPCRHKVYVEVNFDLN